MHRIINVTASIAVIAYCIFSLLSDIQNDINWILIVIILLIISIIIEIGILKHLFGNEGSK